MSERLTDERLAWLAVREPLSRKASRGTFLARLMRAHPYFKERISEKMMDYGLAVDQIAQTLNPEDRRTLRETGQVPDWFLDHVERQFRAIREH